MRQSNLNHNSTELGPVNNDIKGMRITGRITRVENDTAA